MNTAPTKSATSLHSNKDRSQTKTDAKKLPQIKIFEANKKIIQCIGNPVLKRNSIYVSIED